MSKTLSSPLRTLLAERINSFEKLELVMILRKAGEGRSTSNELASMLAIDRDDVRRLVSDLAADGLIKQAAKDDIRLAPSAADEAVLDELEAQYDVDKIILVMTIAESAMERLRNLAGRALAEAFVIRKKPGGDDDR